VDAVVDKLEGQLRRYKEKVQDHRRTPSTGKITEVPSKDEGAEE
jgi:ribosome-associated translation inhibitor RaiA